MQSLFLNPTSCKGYLNKKYILFLFTGCARRALRHFHFYPFIYIYFFVFIIISIGCHTESSNNKSYMHNLFNMEKVTDQCVLLSVLVPSVWPDSLRNKYYPHFISQLLTNGLFGLH